VLALILVGYLYIVRYRHPLIVSFKYFTFVRIIDRGNL